MTVTLTVQRNVFGTVRRVAHQLHNLENRRTKHRRRNAAQSFSPGDASNPIAFVTREVEVTE